VTGERVVGRARLLDVLGPERMELVDRYLDRSPSRDARRIRVRNLRRYVDDHGHLDYLGDDALADWTLTVADRSGYASAVKATTVVRGFWTEVGEAPPMRYPERWRAVTRGRLATKRPKPDKPYTW